MSAPKHHQPLKGKTIAVSALQGNSDGDEVADLTSDHINYYTYKKLRALGESLGATVTGQVHRRTDCVVATQYAAAAATNGTSSRQQQQQKQQQPTQRVRKAWKLQVPVVSVQWMEDCRTRNLCVPFEPKYIWQEESSQSTSRPTKRRRRDDAEEETAVVSAVQQQQQRHNKKRKASSPIVAVLERKLDLGCCCLCHDEDSDLQTSECEWCVDCCSSAAAVVRT